MDECSFKTPGSIPFKWEIKPGLPKSTAHSNSSYNSPPENLIPPPCMASVSISHSHPLSDSTSNLMIGSSSPSIGCSSFFSHKEAVTFFHRSSLPSPSRRRRRYDQTPDPPHQAAKPLPSMAQLQLTLIPPGCFHVPSWKRKDHKNSSNGVEVSSPCRTRMSSATFSPP